MIRFSEMQPTLQLSKYGCVGTMSNSVVKQVAFAVLKDAENHYKQHKKFSDESLQELHSLFGTVFQRCAELLERGKIIQYQTPDSCRKILKVISTDEQYTIFNDVNFCSCHFFRHQVLETGNSLTCKHVLAAKLAQIRGALKIETVGEDKFKEFLDLQSVD